MQTLMLTKAEMDLFQRLPEALKEGWKVEEERLTFEDTDERRRTRFEMMHIESPILLELQKKVRNIQSEDEFMSLAQSVDFSKISPSDLSELLFAIGPDGMGGIIEGMLGASKSSSDVADAAQMAGMRHDLLDSLQNVSS